MAKFISILTWRGVLFDAHIIKNVNADVKIFPALLQKINYNDLRNLDVNKNLGHIDMNDSHEIMDVIVTVD